jgi:subtilisin family serine protease
MQSPRLVIRTIALSAAFHLALSGCTPIRSPIATSPDRITPALVARDTRAADRSIAGLARKGRVAVLLREGADHKEFANRLAARGKRLRGQDRALGLISVEAADAADLAKDPAVAAAWPDAPRPRVSPPRHLPSLSEIPPEPLQELQWGLQVVRAPDAWQKGFSGRGIRIAVLDSGIDPDNPDLAPSIDFARSRSFVPSEDLVDRNGHGSHVAGIIAAPRNGFGVVGVAPDASIVMVKVLDQDAYGDDFGILAGMRYASDIGADVINLSLQTRLPWGSPEAGQAALAFGRAVRYATRRGALVVAGTGNDGEAEFTSGWTHLPAALPHVLGVSAVGPVMQQGFGAFAAYSNTGTTLVDVAAPGGGIGFDPLLGPFVADPRDLVMSTWSTHANPREVMGVPLGPAPWSYFAGTSMACAFASGVAALAIEAHREPPQAIAGRLRHTASGGSNQDPTIGAGVLDASRVVRRGG